MMNSADLARKVTEEEQRNLPATITREQWRELGAMVLRLEHRIVELESYLPSPCRGCSLMEGRQASDSAEFRSRLQQLNGWASAEIGKLQERVTDVERQAKAIHRGGDIDDLVNCFTALESRLGLLESQAVRYTQAGPYHKHLVKESKVVYAVGRE